MKSGNLNFLEPSGPPQACNGTALPLPVLLRIPFLSPTDFYSTYLKKIASHSSGEIALT